MTLTKKSLAFEEGFSPKPYRDADGFAIGYGRNYVTNPWTRAESRFLGLPRDWGYEPMTRDEAGAVLDSDIKWVEAAAVAVFGHDWHGYNGARQAAIANIIYQHGLPKFKKWVKFIAAVKAQKWGTASEEAADSVTARKHLARYDRICRALAYGKAPAEWEAQEV